MKKNPKIRLWIGDENARIQKVSYWATRLLLYADVEALPLSLWSQPRRASTVAHSSPKRPLHLNVSRWSLVIKQNRRLRCLDAWLLFYHTWIKKSNKARPGPLAKWAWAGPGLAKLRKVRPSPVRLRPGPKYRRASAGLGQAGPAQSTWHL